MPRIAPERSALRVAALDLVGDRAVAHAEDLEPAGVGDHRLVPAHEVVDPAEALDQLRPGGEEQVERVREHHVVAEVAGLGDLERLDHRLRGERDEGGRADLAVVEAQDAGAGARRGVARADREARAPLSRRGGGARPDALPEPGQLLELVVREVAQEALADAVEVGRARAREQRLAGVGQHREAAAAVGRAGVADDQALALEPVDEARDARAAQQHAVGQLGHPQPLARRRLQVDQHVVRRQREIVRRQQLGVELADQGGVHAEKPRHAPSSTGVSSPAADRFPPVRSATSEVRVMAERIAGY